MRVLVTRPIKDAKPLVAALEARGHEVLVEPMLTITPVVGAKDRLDLNNVQALLFTSANGLRAFAGLSDERALPVFTVGDTSATAARSAGFARVTSANGDVADLTRLVIAQVTPEVGLLFHAAASKLAGDLQGGLEAAGFTLRRAVLYDAVPVHEISPRLRRVLVENQLDAATFFSPRTAETFVQLIETAGLEGACVRLSALCLSTTVASSLAALPWDKTLVAARPDQDALLASLDTLAVVC